MESSVWKQDESIGGESKVRSKGGVRIIKKKRKQRRLWKQNAEQELVAAQACQQCGKWPEGEKTEVKETG